MSFIQIKNKSGPNTEPCGTPAKAFSQEDVCLSRITGCCHAYK